MNIEETLGERQVNYGNFIDYAVIAVALKDVLTGYKTNYAELSADKRESLDMIMSKVARVLSGNPEYADSWHDIAGYATLIVNSLNQEEVDKPPLTDDIAPNRRKGTSVDMAFPVTKFARTNSIKQQVQHVVCECREVVDAYDGREPYGRVLEEAFDVCQALTTLCVIDPGPTKQARRDVIIKNKKRGYYDD